MKNKPGRPLHGDKKKKNYSVTLDPDLVEKIKKEFNNNLSLGITILGMNWESDKSGLCEKE